MKKRKRTEGGSEEGSWLNTYADMVTLMLTFFIMLFTMSSVDAEKWQILMKAFSNKSNETAQVVLVPEGLGVDLGTNQGEGVVEVGETLATDPTLPDNFDELYRYIQTYIRENQLEGSVEIFQGDNSVFIRFRDNFFFDPDASNLRRQSTLILDFMGGCFNNINAQILAIRINGHTASVPGSPKVPGFDRRLSTDRANSVLIYLEEQAKVDPKKLIALGYGRNYPVASNDTEEGRIQNRRVEMMILSHEIAQGGDNDIYNILQGDYGFELNSPLHDMVNSQKILVPGSQ